MKKLLYMVVLIALFIASAAAQSGPWAVHTGDKPGKGSFLGPNVTTLIVSNLVSITNYTIPGVLGGTNMTGNT